MRGKWEFKGFWLDQPHPERGGYFYACQYDAGGRRVVRKSLRTADFEAAKQALVDLASATPRNLSPETVSTAHVIEQYLDGHAQGIATAAYAERVGQIVGEFMQARGNAAAPVSWWTPSRQLDFCRWCVETLNHKPATIERNLNVVRAAFRDAATVKLRLDAMGQETEAAIISHAPQIVYKAARIAKELRVPNEPKKPALPTPQDVARFIDALDTASLRRWVLLALATWARPEAITDLDYDAYDARSGALSLNPEGRAQTNKRRAAIYAPRHLVAALKLWRVEDKPEAGEAWPPILRRYGKRIATVKLGVKQNAARLHVPITQKTFRTWMATTVREVAPKVPREKRSIWLGHAVEAGSRTTDFYEINEPAYLRDVALATDYVISELQKLCTTKFTAIELQLNDAELRRIGARPLVRKAREIKRIDGAARED